VFEARMGFERGNIDLDDGRYDEACAHLAAAAALSGTVGDRRAEAMARANLGDAERRRGRLDEAREHLASAVRQLDLTGHAAAPIVRAMLGEVAADSGDVDGAAALLRTAAEELRAQGDPREADVLAKLAEALRDPEGLVRAEVVARASGDPLLLARVLVRRGHAELDAGGDARPTLLEAERRVSEGPPHPETRDAVAALRLRLRRGP